MANATNSSMVGSTAIPTTIMMTTITAMMFNQTDNGTTSNNTVRRPPPPAPCPGQKTEQDRIIKMTAYAIIILVSLIGNILIAAVILSNKKMRKPTNYFILNMAISDLLIPTMVDSKQLVVLYTQEHSFIWLVDGTFGLILCKLVYFFQDVSTAVSIFSLMLITVDRFIAVVYPMKHYIMSSKVCKISIVATWLLGMSLHAIYLYVYDLMRRNGKIFCSPKWGKLNIPDFSSNYYYMLFFLLAVLPVAVMAVAYTIIIVSLKRQSAPLGDSFSDRQKRQRAERERKIVRMAIAIIISFVILWAPYNVYIFMGLFNLFDNNNKCFILMFHFIGYFCAYANAAVNPCIVFTFSQNFRHGLLQLLAKIGIFKNRNIPQQNTTQVSMTMQNKAFDNDN